MIEKLGKNFPPACHAGHGANRKHEISIPRSLITKTCRLDAWLIIKHVKSPQKLCQMRSSPGKHRVQLITSGEEFRKCDRNSHVVLGTRTHYNLHRMYAFNCGATWSYDVRKHSPMFTRVNVGKLKFTNLIDVNEWLRKVKYLAIPFMRRDEIKFGLRQAALQGTVMPNQHRKYFMFGVRQNRKTILKFYLKLVSRSTTRVFFERRLFAKPPTFSAGMESLIVEATRKKLFAKHLVRTTPKSTPK